MKNPKPATPPHPAIGIGMLLLVTGFIAYAWTGIWQLAVTGLGLLLLSAVFTSVPLKR